MMTFLHINVIIKGGRYVYSSIYQSPTPPPFSHFLVFDQRGGGGGVMAPCAPIVTPVIVV